MHTLHGFAFIPRIFSYPAAPVLARPEPLDAPALKPPPEAGRRGGESIARKVQCTYNFLNKLSKPARLKN
nr:hypothetical protein [Cedecea sp. NFIX57]